MNQIVALPCHVYLDHELFNIRAIKHRSQREISEIKLAKRD